MKQSFNPNARWDRSPGLGVPDSSPGLENEKIQVMAVFRQGKAYPRAFLWNNKEYKINRITYTWQERNGQELITYFSVSTGTDLYQISFNSAKLSWRLDKIIS